MSLPRGWTEFQMSEITPADAPIIYGILQPGPDQSSGIPYVRPTEIENGQIDLANLRRTSSSINRRYIRSVLRANDVILSIVGTIGKVAIVPPELSGGNITQSSCRIRVDATLAEPNFVAEFLRSPLATDQFTAKRLGTAVPRLNLADVRKFRIDLPPLVEQRRIVAKLDAMIARIAGARAELDRVAILVNNIRRQVSASCFEASIETRELGSLLRGIEAGKNMRCEERPPQAGENGIVKVSAVTWGKFDPKESKTLPSDYTPTEKAKIRAGDLLISRANTLELVGSVVLVTDEPRELFLSDKILRLVIDDDAKKWVLWFLRSPWGRKQIEDLATGNQLSMRNISQNALRSIRLPFPDSDTRRRLVERIETSFARADRLETEAARAHALLDRLESAILAKAFRGELVSQDPNDEPASVLLERIRAQRGETPKGKQASRRGKLRPSHISHDRSSAIET